MFVSSVIVSTYNQPEWLQKVLYGFLEQTVTNFEIIIADDGSLDTTKDVVEHFKVNTKLHVSHIWQEDDGFQKNKILNKAILASNSDYLIFTDGDCIPRKDFVETHIQRREKNSFLSGGYFKLPMDISLKITHEDIVAQRCFDENWLICNGLRKTFKLNKLTAKGFKATLLNTLTPTKATWDGMNASGFKKDILAVNGFDERMCYGGEDRELGERLMNLGVKPIQVRYSAICVHLEHGRGYVDLNKAYINKAIRHETKKHKKTWANFGIKKLV